ncbi:hypothetical protein [Streptomyces werraensis]|uniref:hypothetical protein n=1 Tax=Streptomyces werraensis TaxID=68284 RepID=UPI0036FF9F71
MPDVQQQPACAGGCTWRSEVTSVAPDFDTLGVIVAYCEGSVADWVDVYITDLALDSLTEERLDDLSLELGAPIHEMEVSRRQYAHGHVDVPGSSSFTVIRLSRVGVGFA